MASRFGYTKLRMLAFTVFGAVLGFALLVLLVLVARSGLARPLAVWSLAALLPLLAALTMAFGAQARAAQTLASYRPTETSLVLSTGGKEYDLTLSPRQAACLERTLRLRVKADLILPDEKPVPLRSDTKVTGDLPAQKYVEALAIGGQLGCSEFRHVASDSEK